MDDLAKFLVKAKKNTYASNGKETIFEDGSRELVYEENEFRYRDRYFGFDSFIGEEIVWKNRKIIWGMNYSGRILKKTIPAKQIYNFLKESLKNISSEKPFRGPDNFKKSDLEYKNKTYGGIENFKGAETIFYKGKKVYVLEYHGGLLNG